MFRTWFDMPSAAREQLPLAPGSVRQASFIHPPEGFTMSKPFSCLLPVLAILAAENHRVAFGPPACHDLRSLPETGL